MTAAIAAIITIGRILAGGALHIDVNGRTLCGRGAVTLLVSKSSASAPEICPQCWTAANITTTLDAIGVDPRTTEIAANAATGVYARGPMTGPMYDAIGAGYPTGTLVHYVGSLTAEHGTYRVVSVIGETVKIASGLRGLRCSLASIRPAA